MKNSEKILLLGLGGMGRYLAQRLSHEGHQVTVIESRDETVWRADAELDARLILGDAMSFACWEEAHASEMDYLISVTDDDAVNMMASLIADKVGIQQKIARIRGVRVWEEHAPLKAADLAIDLVIRPEELAAQEITRLLKMQSGNVVVDVGDGRLQVIATHVRSGSPLAGRRVRDFGEIFPDFHVQVVAVGRDLETIIPGGNTTIEVDDHVHLLANRRHMDEVMATVGVAETRRQRVLIIGGGLVGERCAALLEDAFEVRLLEASESRAEELAFRRGRTDCLHGDGSDRNTLISAGLFHTDVIVAATGDNETNIMSCVLAKHLVDTRHEDSRLDAIKTIAMVEREEYVLLASAMGTDVAVNKKVLAANQVLRHIRRGHVLSVAHLHGCEAEVVELLASPGAAITKRVLAEIEELPGHILIGAVHRDDGWMVARGNTLIQAGDRVVCISASSHLGDLQALFLA